MRVRVGTSGWSYPEWKGSFYPEKLPGKEMLRFYAQRFPTVEVNNTFYRLPRENVIQGWAAEVPEDFQFVIKASRRITHDRRLREVESYVEYLLRNASLLERKLGPFLVQLPPNFKKDLPRLVDFMQLLPHGIRAAFEFRNVSWFDDEVFAALGERGHALCVADTGDGSDAPFVATTDWGYLRLQRVEYGERELADWASRIAEQSWRDAFVFSDEIPHTGLPRTSTAPHGGWTRRERSRLAVDRGGVVHLPGGIRVCYNAATHFTMTAVRRIRRRTIAELHVALAASRGRSWIRHIAGIRNLGAVHDLSHAPCSLPPRRHRPDHGKRCDGRARIRRRVDRHDHRRGRKGGRA